MKVLMMNYASGFYPFFLIFAVYLLGKIRFGRIMGYGQVGTAFQKCRNYLKRLKWKISRKASLSVVLPYGSTHREPKVLP